VTGSTSSVHIDTIGIACLDTNITVGYFRRWASQTTSSSDQRTFQVMHNPFYWVFLPKFAEFDVDYIRYKTYAYENFNKSKIYATGHMKQAVIAPSMLSLLYPLREEIPGYSRADFFTDLVNEVRSCTLSGWLDVDHVDAGRKRHQGLFCSRCCKSFDRLY
jgi:hypothetical protein